MQNRLLSDIDAFLADTGMTDWAFGYQAAKNGRLVERLRGGGRIWPDTEQQVRAFMIAAKQAPRLPKTRGSNTGVSV